MARTTFEGKSAIITGGASGIGRALGKALCERGAHVVLADINGAAATDAARELTGPVAAIGAEVDVSDAEAMRSLVQETATRHGRVDLMFNNAGISMGGETHELTAAHWDHIIDVNIKGVVNGVLAAYPLMIDQGKGHIVNTASGAGLAPLVFTVPYAATKHAVVGLSTALRPEAALHGVRVSVICPGAVETAILDQSPSPDLPPLERTLTARDYLRVVGFSPMDADRFARRALQGVARNLAVIIAPKTAKAMWYGHRLSPGMTDRVGRITARRVLRELDRRGARSGGAAVPADGERGKDGDQRR